MNPSHQSTLRTLLYFGALLAAIAGAFLFGYWQVRPRGEDQFTRLLNVGKNYYDQGNAPRAVETFQKAAGLNPGQMDVLLNLANAYLLAGDANAAIQTAQQVEGSEPNSAAAHYIKGCAYLRLNGFEDAVKELQAAKDIDQKVNAVSFQLGRAYQGWGKLEEAAQQFDEVIQFEDHAAPDYAVAHYNLGQVLVRLGQTDRANELLTQYQKLLAEHPNRNTDLVMLERCVYTQARVPFELERPSPTGVKVVFEDATLSFFGADAAKYRGPVGVLDVNHRGTNDLFVAEGDAGFRLLLNSNATFRAEGELLPSIPQGHYSRCLVGDLNNDRIEDVVMVGDKGVQAFRFATNGVVTDATTFSNLKDTPAVDGALVDLDFTGKLDLLLIPPETNTVRVLRNLGNMYFKDGTSTSGVPSSISEARHLVVDDWNNDDIMDVFVVRTGQPPLVLVKQRGGPLTDTNTPSHWPNSTAIAIGDLNNDLRNDFVLAAPGHLECVFDGLTNHLSLPTGDFAVTGLVLVDYDNDGWLDICARGNGLRVWRNLGPAGFHETTAELGLDKLVHGTVDQVALADFDNDGDTDFLVSIQGRGLQLLRNNGGNANQQLKLQLIGNRSNASALGIRIELTAGHWRTIRTVSELPVEIGVGARKQLDAVDVHWIDTSSASVEVPVDSRASLALQELIIPTGSCPYLYAWDGQRFRFVTDILGASPAGLPVAEGRMIEADPDEFVALGTDEQIKPRGDSYLLQITEELREVLYLDEAKLVVVDHPTGTEVHPTDKLLPGGPFPPSELITVARRYTLRAATTLEGRDVTALLEEIDGKLVSPPRLRVPQLRGLAEPHGVILDFGPLPIDRPLVLALTGWLRFGGGTANVAASQNPDLPFPFPVLAAETANGLWTPVDVQVGAPAGKTKTILVDLAGKLPVGARRLKVSSAFELHWDRAALFERTDGGATRITSLVPSQTDLHWRGFSQFEKHPWFVPQTPNYDRVRARPPWLITPEGWCTRYGQVDELVSKRDDALVLLNGGDELTLAFRTDRLPAKPAGAVREFFLYSVGWDKDADFHVLAGTTVGPLPFHGMDDQRYGQVQRSSVDQKWWTDKYNTRWVSARAVNHQNRPDSALGSRVSKLPRPN
jgi:tetratricopeptide (TPR) repeat protein